jgi:anthranilate synthase component 1
MRNQQLGVSAPDLDDFRRLARERRVIPVVRRLLADAETPIGLYRKLAADRAGTFLLESAEHGRSWSRYSFVGVRSRAMLTSENGEVRWLGSVPAGLPQTGPALPALRDTLQLLHTEPLEGLPPFTGGLVGLISYDAVRNWERLGDHAVDDTQVPEIAMLLATDLAVLDHADGTVLLIANAINWDASDERVDDAWTDALQRLDAMEQALAAPLPSSAAVWNINAEPLVISTTSREKYLDDVEICKEHIRAGDAFQIVLSQRFEVATSASSLDVYRALRVSNPSPYMYLLRLPSGNGDSKDFPEEVAFDIVGSSPEALVKLQDGRALLHPIAGTRPRGATTEDDALLAKDLLHDPKERAEHLMLVDLGRNDLGRVCEPGSVEVIDFMTVERYSHVMHIVSTVVGKLRSDKTAYDLLASTFPAGTLSGAPKPRAMEIIESLEPVRRGAYGGCIGYFDFAGNMDTAIAIRTAMMRDGRAYVQAGAGIVADSVPETECQECENKARAVLRAIAMADSLQQLAN